MFAAAATIQVFDDQCVITVSRSLERDRTFIRSRVFSGGDLSAVLVQNLEVEVRR